MLIDQNRRITLRELASCQYLFDGNDHRILHNQLGMRRVTAQWIPRLLNKDQKQAWVSSAQGFLQRFHSEGQQFLDRIITVNETCPGYQHLIPRQNGVPLGGKHPHPSPQKARICRSQKKQMFIVFYNRKGVILCHGVPVGKTIHSEYYQKVYIILIFFYFSKLSAFMKET